jgi:hypothetical protein
MLTWYRMACLMLVLSVTCFALAFGLGSYYYGFISMVCVVLAGQIYATEVQRGKDKAPARRH